MEYRNDAPLREVEISSDASCPSCGRFVGPYEKCPYCQADLKKRLSLKLVKRIAVIGSVVGLIMLWYASKIKEIPQIQISSITERMNNALVKITGTVVSGRTDESKNSIRLIIEDGTGKITLNGFNALKDFKNYFGENLPQEGDEICVAGQLNINEKFGTSMFIKNPKRIAVLKKCVISEKKIKDITKDDVKKVFKFKVTIEDVNEFTVGKSIEVKDATGNIQLTVFNSQYTLITDTITRENLVSPGAEFEMVAIVDMYRENFQLKLKNPENPENLICLKKGSGASELQINEENTTAIKSPPKKKIEYKDEGADLIIEEEK